MRLTGSFQTMTLQGGVCGEDVLQGGVEVGVLEGSGGEGHGGSVHWFPLRPVPFDYTGGYGVAPV